MAKTLVSGELWAVVELLLPVATSRPFPYPGHQPIDQRRALPGSLLMPKTGTT